MSYTPVGSVQYSTHLCSNVSRSIQFLCVKIIKCGSLNFVLIVRQP